MGSDLIIAEVNVGLGARYTRTMKTLTARSMCRWIGNRVRLKPNVKEGWKEEFGSYEGASGDGCCIVTVDEKYRDGKLDDGVREVTYDQIEKVYVPGQRAPKE